MSIGRDNRWSGSEFLAQVGGNALEFPPARVLFLAQRLGASGRLWLTQGADIRTIDVKDGVIVGCSGIPDLLGALGVEGERGDGLSDLVDKAVAGGASAEDALGACARRLGQAVVSWQSNEDLMVQFAMNAPGPLTPMAMPLSPMEMVLEGVRGSGLVAEARGWLMVEAAASPQVRLPEDAPRESWGLGEAGLGLLDAASAASTLGDLKLGQPEEWLLLAVLRLLGLIDHVVPHAEPVAPAAVPQPPKRETLSAVPSEPQSPSRPASPAEDAGGRVRDARFDRPHDRSGEVRSPRRKRRTGRAGLAQALQRNPWQSPPEKVEVHLKAAYEALGATRPEVALGIRKVDDLADEVIEQRYRDACARYHPDRYLGSNQAVRALAEGCFSRVSDAYHRLKDPATCEQARDRLVFKETGKRPVNDKTRSRARVDFKRAEMLFRQRKYDDAAKSAARACTGDPERWEYKYLHLRAAWHAGQQDTQTTVDAVLALEGMSSIERGEAIYVAGEMQLKDGRKTEAYKLFRQAVSVDPENVGARRRIRLEGSRKAKEAGKGGVASKSGDSKKGGRPLFGGLFGRRGN